jgi:hypothetical protein
MAEDKDPKQRTLYDVLGVARTAKNTDITRAWNRVKADQERDDVSPDARLMAQAQVAFETLSDPDKRDAYDQSLLRAASKSRVPMWSGVAAGIAVAAVAGYFLMGRSKGPEAPKPLSREEVLQAVGPYVGELKGALVSGEVRTIGEAVVVAEDQMATTCKGFVPGAQLTMKVGDFSTQASLTRVDETLDVCVLTVPSMGTAVKVRQSLPAPREEVHAIVIDAAGKPQLRQASIAGFIEDPKGTVLQVQSAVPLPNGTPVFDAQARLTAIVSSPHAYGEGKIVALPAARVLVARNAAASATTAPPEGARPAAPAEKAAKEADNLPPQGAARSKELEKAYDVRTKMLNEAEQHDAGAPPPK